MKELLGRIGWSQAYFADYMGIPENTVSNWVRGRREGSGYQCAMKHLELVARILGV